MEGEKKPPQTPDEIAETIRIAIDPVESKRMCEACYWRGRSDATWIFLICLLVMFSSYSLARTFLRVTE
jgi:hypothetical protein